PKVEPSDHRGRDGFIGAYRPLEQDLFHGSKEGHIHVLTSRLWNAWCSRRGRNCGGQRSSRPIFDAWNTCCSIGTGRLLKTPGQNSVTPVKVQPSMRRAGTTAAPRKPLIVLRELLTALTPASASRYDCVNRRFRTGPTISPRSTRKVPSRVMPVIIASFGWTTFV